MADHRPFTLLLVDHLFGAAAARGVGRGMVIAWPPAAAQMPALVVAGGGPP